MSGSATKATTEGSASARSKRQLPSNAMVFISTRVGRRTDARLRNWTRLQDAKQLADAWRDVINAGMRALGIPELSTDQEKELDDVA